MTLGTAIAKVYKDFDTIRIVDGVETRNWFKFFVTDATGNLIGNSSTMAVNKKTGEVGWKYIMDPLFSNDEIIMIYDNEDIKKASDQHS